MAKAYTIWCNAHLPDVVLHQLRKDVGGHQLVLSSSLNASNLTPGAADPLMNEADIAFGQPDPEQVLAIPTLRWVHLSSAGYTRYDRSDLKITLRSRGGGLTTSSTVYSEPCAQHVLAMMMGIARQLPASLDDQRTAKSWKYLPIRTATKVLRDQRVLILGFGSIARRLVELLAPFNLDIIGVRRTVSGKEPVRIVTTERADELLPEADHIVNILPASDATKHFINAARLARCKPGAIFYNVGRGDTVDQPALIDALNSGRLSAAYLDVTSPEPLPPDHPLWTTPNCYITPHTAGGFSDEMPRLAQHFVENFRRLLAGAPLKDLVS